MLRLPAICHIGECRAVVRPGRIPHARNLLPLRRVDCGKMGVALGPDVNFGDLKAIGNVHPLRIDFGAPDHGGSRRVQGWLRDV